MIQIVVPKLFPTKTNIICCGMFVMSVKYLILVMHHKCSFVRSCQEYNLRKKMKKKQKTKMNKQLKWAINFVIAF